MEIALKTSNLSFRSSSATEITISIVSTSSMVTHVNCL